MSNTIRITLPLAALYNVNLITEPNGGRVEIDFTPGQLVAFAAVLDDAVNGSPTGPRGYAGPNGEEAAKRDAAARSFSQAAADDLARAVHKGEVEGLGLGNAGPADAAMETPIYRGPTASSGPGSELAEQRRNGFVR